MDCIVSLIVGFVVGGTVMTLVMGAVQWGHR